MRAPARVTAALFGAVLAAAAFTGCAGVPAPAPTATHQGEATVSPETVTSAVAASDPRITEVITVQVVQSGLARIMNVAVAVSGDEPVSTETVVNIAAAALENAKSDVDDVVLFVRDDDDTSRLLDLTEAAAGLPPGVTTRLTDGSLEIIGADLAELRGR